MHELDKQGMRRAIAIATGIVINVVLSFLANRFGLPLYLDTIGTIGVSILAGYFPGILTALATNLICTFFNPLSIYYSILSVLIALCASLFHRKDWLKKPKGIIGYIFLAAFFGGALGSFFQWALLGEPQFGAVRETAETISSSGGIGYAFSFVAVNFFLNLIDKGITTAVALVIIRLIPVGLKREIWNGGWRQKPLSAGDLKLMKRNRTGKKGSLQTKMTIMLTVAAVILTVAMGVVSMKLYFEKTKDEYSQIAKSAAHFAAEILDPDEVDHYLEKGRNAAGYAETVKMFERIRENSPGVEYLYAVKILQDGCYFIIDLESDGMEAYQPGEKVEFEEAFEPYLPDLFAGKEIEPIESDDVSGWVLTVYEPVRNSAGETVCYVGADISMQYLSDYVRDYLFRVLFLFSGFFVLVLAYGVWLSRMYLSYPINSMALSADRFTDGNPDQEELDAHVNDLKSIDIRTGDEVEKLYRAICKMAQNTAEQMRGIRHYAQTTEKMQSGLIITMADMVENRDSDTGAHIQKTAAYVRIIMEGLLRKGYYTEKITPKYMTDVEMSAPLHDVGKINIPDAILNKPGKLEPDEFEIMKTHTTAGKVILENAISTVQGENYLKEARNMAAYHHERWDGKGYPEGLHGEVIPLSARIMAVADVFDALASPRIYKPAFPLEKALEIIREGAGTQFDPKVVEVFMDSLADVKQVLKKYQES
ncbi:MAG: HD domain-containing protein [Lachnospiraceae bacterium]|nr:HD domain-containing protein [Lachnospiraceae bacterium]